jgi:hypothetical protein
MSEEWGTLDALWGTGWIWGADQPSSVPRYYLDLMLDGETWTDVTEDTRATTPIVASYGIDGAGPTDRVASTGTLNFALDNSEHNSAGLLGYYAPGHSNCRTGFEVGCPARLRVVYQAVTYYKFVGTLETIDPDSGQYLKRSAQCQAVDWLDEAAKQKIRLLPTQTDQRGDELIATIIAAMAKQPIDTDLASGDSVFPYSLDNSHDEKSSPMSEFQRIAMSEMGYLFLRGDTTAGGLLTFQARSTRNSLLTSQVTIDNEMTGLRVGRKRAEVWNRVRVTTHPRRIDAAATTVLFALTGTPKVEGRQTVTLLGQYRDPNQISLRCGGMDMVTPAATTDYTMNAEAGGGGANLTANFTVTASYGGNGVQLVITNNGTTAGYVTKMQCRGRGVYDDAPIVLEASDSGSQTTYGENVLSIDMPMQSDALVGQAAADYLISALAAPLSAIESMDFTGHTSDDLMEAGLAREPGDRVTIIETATGVSGDYLIQNVHVSIAAGGVFRFKWGVTPAAPYAMWLLGVAGVSELGETTILGY